MGSFFRDGHEIEGCQVNSFYARKKSRQRCIYLAMPWEYLFRRIDAIPCIVELWKSWMASVRYARRKRKTPGYLGYTQSTRGNICAAKRVIWVSIHLKLRLKYVIGRYTAERA